MDPQHQDQDYLADVVDFSPGSPDNFQISLDPDPFDYSNLGSPPFPHTPSYNGSFHNSPYSNHSELSFNGERETFGIFEEDHVGGISSRDYDPSEFDTVNPQTTSLLMFNENDYIHSNYDPSQLSTVHISSPDLRGPYDYSSPSSNGSGEEGQQQQLRSRGSSVSSNHNNVSPSPRLDVSAFENLSFHSPSWGTDPLPRERPVSPHTQKPQSPPRLVMPESSGSPTPAFAAPPTINAPDGDGVHPRLHIVPATPVSGGGPAATAVPFQNGSDPLRQGASSEQSTGWKAPPQAEEYDFNVGHDGLSTANVQMLNNSVNGNDASSPYLFPGIHTRGRRKSDPGLEPPTWDLSSAHVSSTHEDAVSMAEVEHGSMGGSHRNSFNGTLQSFPLESSAHLLNPNPKRGHVRQSRSEDLRVNGMFHGGSPDFLRADAFLSPMDPPPPIRNRHYRSASTGGGSLRSERGATLGGSGQWSAASSQRASPYPSPNVSPQPNYSDLPPEDPSLIVSKPNVTTPRTSTASHSRRKQEATFICPVPGCGSTFTRSFNLKGHIRSHNEEKPFLCKWPGCGKGFARQHDCKRHEQLHTNYRPFTCEGCSKQFARMDALNRHLRSDGGIDCQRVLEASGRLPEFSGGGKGSLMPDAGGGRIRSYSMGSYSETPEPPMHLMPKVEDPWANMTGVAL
ncbi:unnamed protein product [Mycena citricolor]|uniref:C2H2-type domain-containing protein n=1 Tax=Mycena citricolor TaxID=2018698 RepID=A0AAD2H8P1_9AGAR|nr:unnamed protein product [Mycena citricolor]CAK5269705.1 unnamed protein product [Mycena citricolor]